MLILMLIYMENKYSIRATDEMRGEKRNGQPVRMCVFVFAVSWERNTILILAWSGRLALEA